nr:PREDICTED: phospholipase A2 inhibitor and Ly6/PLAUR domain-containing protein [Anolis carolinensis]|eukprot:XP_008111984.2 PREDICTED: phospholipase A2 inhibitor and Ly6/PLAUR domain-containing protein [Anolis carolinensis]
MECEICESEGITCSGRLEKCPSKKDVCIHAVVRSTIFGNTSMNTIKNCGNLDMCGSPAVVLSMGKQTTYMTSLVCCKGRECQNISPQIPITEFMLNGKKCPACYTALGTCDKNSTVACIGSQDFCFDMSALLRLGGKDMTYTMKGCTTQAVCASLSSSRALVLGEAIITKIECTPDPLHGSASSKFFQPLFYGLLLLKTLL